MAAISGGKDSASMLAVLSSLSPRLGFDLVAVHMDLGLGEYSRRSLDKARELARALGVELVTISVEDLVGVGVPLLARRAKRPVCSVCGTVKRYLLNAAAVELGADSVALGHTLTDIATYILKEFLRQNLGAIGKLGPKTERVDGLAVGRIRPLYEVTERETLVYALVKGLPFLRDECPYVRRDTMDFTLKRKLLEIERTHPGTLLGLVRGVYRNIDIYRPEGHVTPCSVCGLISSGEVCSFCKLTRTALGAPSGARIRALLEELLPSKASARKR